MTPLCKVEMTLPEGFPGGLRGEGSADERWGAVASRSAARFGSETVDDGGKGAAARGGTLRAGCRQSGIVRQKFPYRLLNQELVRRTESKTAANFS
jgi:hypothetical protein